MVISIVEKNEFIPEWNGNRQLPVAEQIRILHKAPTINIKERVNPRRFDIDNNGNISSSVEIDRKKTLMPMVTGIQNVAYIDGDGVEHKINTVDQLFNAPAVFDSLIDEIYAYLQELLRSEVDEKN